MDIKNLTRRQLAQCFGVTERTISRWADLGMPRDGRRYDLTACIVWRTEQLKAANRSDPNRQLERLRRHKANLARLEYRRRAGELVSREATTDAFRRGIVIARNRLLAIPSRAANELSGTLEHEIIAKVVEILTNEIKTALDDLAATT